MSLIWRRARACGAASRRSGAGEGLRRVRARPLIVGGGLSPSETTQNSWRRPFRTTSVPYAVDTAGVEGEEANPAEDEELIGEAEGEEEDQETAAAAGGEGDGEDTLHDSDLEDIDWDRIREPGGRGSRNDGTYYQGVRENMDGGPPFRQPRPHLPLIKELSKRQVPEIREDPMNKKQGFMIDMLEHEAYLNRFRDAESGGAFMDHEVALYDEWCEEDPFYNEYLTEDEYMWPDDWEDQPYVPDAVRQQMYFLWSYKKMDLPALAAKFKMRTERVAGIIALKRTEPEMIRQGMYTDKIDKAMTQLYADEKKAVDPDWNEEDSLGLNIAVLQDAQLPKDAVPKMRWKGNRLRVGIPMPARELPAKEERKFHSRFAIKSLSGPEKGIHGALKRHVVVDFDGTRRTATKREELYRSNRVRRFLPKRTHYGSNNMPFPDEELDRP